MPETLFLKEKQRVLKVSELARAINQLLEGSVPLLWVRGEISNLVKASSGHWYFALKDEQAQVRCVMFRQKSILQDHVLENGVQVAADSDHQRLVHRERGGLNRVLHHHPFLLRVVHRAAENRDRQTTIAMAREERAGPRQIRPGQLLALRHHQK